MIIGLIWLLACQLVGELIVRVLDIPIPGPVVGMLVLFVLLRVRRSGADAAVVKVGEGVLRHLQLFFVPAGVGVVVYLGTLRDNAAPILVALLGSWLIGLAVVGWVTQLLERLLHKQAFDG